MVGRGFGDLGEEESPDVLVVVAGDVAGFGDLELEALALDFKGDGGVVCGGFDVVLVAVRPVHQDFLAVMGEGVSVADGVSAARGEIAAAFVSSEEFGEVSVDGFLRLLLREGIPHLVAEAQVIPANCGFGECTGRSSPFSSKSSSPMVIAGALEGVALGLVCAPAVLVEDVGDFFRELFVHIGGHFSRLRLMTRWMPKSKSGGSSSRKSRRRSSCSVSIAFICGLYPIRRAAGRKFFARLEKFKAVPFGFFVLLQRQRGGCGSGGLFSAHGGGRRRRLFAGCDSGWEGQCFGGMRIPSSRRVGRIWATWSKSRSRCSSNAL